MNNAMQLKAVIKKIAGEKKISAQLVLQNYMLERFLERVSLSPWQKNFVIKGGFLITSIVGLSNRATMDLDATIKAYPVNEKAIRKMVEDIIMIPVDDDIQFEIRGLGEIREGDEYTGYRVALSANYPPIAVPLKLDITTGDRITPREIEFAYKLMLEDRSICVMAYNLVTVLAEKLETVISRGDQNTRPRDYYDIFILTKLQKNNIDMALLGDAIYATAEKRNSLPVLKNYRAVMHQVQSSSVMNMRWKDYSRNFEYASGIEFAQTCDAVIQTMDQLRFVWKPEIASMNNDQSEAKPTPSHTRHRSQERER